MSENVCYHCFAQRTSQTGPCSHCGYDPEKEQEQYPLALPLGSILNGRYTLGRVLGQGGFGITYVAQDVQTGQRVAIKEFLPESLAIRKDQYTVSPYSGQRQEDFQYGIQCFLSEAQTLAQFIGAENIVRVHCYFEENGTAYFAMDYIEGQSLQTYLKQKGGRLNWEEAKAILLPVMDAMSLVHSKGIIHRDIAPDNIYITTDGTVKLLDFGAARYSLGDRSRSLDVVLKAGYAPSEQYVRRGRQGPFTDIYALAATWYFAITGRTPPESVERLDEDNLVLPSSYGVALPREGEDALVKALSVRAPERYQTMQEFREALCAQPEPEPAPVPEVRQEKPAQAERPAVDAAKPQKRMSIAAIAVCAVVVLCAAVLVLVLGRDSAERVSGPGQSIENTADGVLPYNNETVVARIGEHFLTNAQLQAFYGMEVRTFLANYGSYASMLGLDLTKPLNEQPTGENSTWEQDFLESALNTWKNYQVMCDAAEAEGFSLSAQGRAELDRLEQAVAETAASYGMGSAEEFLAAYLGDIVIMEDYEHYIKLYYLGTEYFDHLCEQNAPDVKEVEAYYAQHESEYLAGGLSREEKCVNVRHLMISRFDADGMDKILELLNLFEAGDRSEESFAALVQEHSQDTVSAADGGLLENVKKGDMVDSFDTWCFDEARKPGDYDMVETEYGYHLVYFISSDFAWNAQVESDMMVEISESLLAEIMKDTTMDVSYEDIRLCDLDLTFGTQAEQ